MTQMTLVETGAVDQHPRAPLWVAKLYYFSFFAAIGAIAPFFNLFLQARGLSGVEIGLMGSIPPLIALAANPFWGGLADRWQWHQRVLALCALVAGLLSILFIFANSFAPLLLLLVFMVFFRTPVPTLLDTAVLGMVARTGASYGRQRLFGSIGFLIFSLGLGQIVTSANLSAIFWVHGAFFVLACAPLSLLLPFERTSERSDLLQGLRKLARQGSYMSFLVMNVVMGLGTACYVNFIGLRILQLGGTEAMVGLGYALNAVTEIPIMFVGARLMARFNHGQLILAGLLGLRRRLSPDGPGPDPADDPVGHAHPGSLLRRLLDGSRGLSPTRPRRLVCARRVRRWWAPPRAVWAGRWVPLSAACFGTQPVA